MRKLWLAFKNWLYSLFNLDVDLGDLRDLPPTERRQDWQVRSRYKVLTAKWCADHEGQGYAERFAAPAPGWFWRKDRGELNFVSAYRTGRPDVKVHLCTPHCRHLWRLYRVPEGLHRG